MRVDITAYMNKDEDGFEGSANLTRDDVPDLYGLADLFAQFARSAGYTYVNAVGFEQSDGTMVWGDI